MATTVHEVQVLEEGRIPMTAHDLPLDLISTPDRLIVCRDRGRGRRANPGVRWVELTEEKIAAIPLLKRLLP